MGASTDTVRCSAGSWVAGDGAGAGAGEGAGAGAGAGEGAGAGAGGGACERGSDSSNPL